MRVWSVSSSQAVCCNAHWTPSADSELRQTSSRLRAIPCHTGTPDLKSWSQNKTSQSNHEKRWATRRKGAEKEVSICAPVHERESEWETGLRIINPMNPEAPGWLSEVFVCLKARTILSAALTLWENNLQGGASAWFLLLGWMSGSSDSQQNIVLLGDDPCYSV